MKKIKTIKIIYSDRIPNLLENGILYISKKFSTAAHNCCCGCESKIVTPLKSGQWRLDLKKNSASLYPSIGNWSSACQSHYWIRNGKVEWSTSFDIEKIAANRQSDQATLDNIFLSQTKKSWNPLSAVISKIKKWFF